MNLIKGLVKKEEGKIMSRMYNYYQIGLIFSAFVFLFYSNPQEVSAPVDFSPLYRDAIKAVDPLEILKKGMGSPSDRAEY